MFPLAIKAQGGIVTTGLKGHFDVKESGGYSGSTVYNLATTSVEKSPNIYLSGAAASFAGMYFDGGDWANWSVMVSLMELRQDWILTTMES